MTWYSLPGRGTKVRLALTTGILVAGMAACDSNATGPETQRSAQVQVLLTDAPSDMLDSARVWVSHVYLQGGGGSVPDTAQADSTSAGGGRVDLYNDPANPLSYDLLTLRDSVTADITGLVTVDAGTYQGLRFVVDSARVVLKEGYTFEDGTNSAAMKVPGGSTSGIKVKLKDVLLANEGETTTVTVDFDVDANFVIQTNPQSGLVKKVMFTPVLKERSRKSTSS